MSDRAKEHAPPTGSSKSGSPSLPRNEGEGSRSAARHYDKKTEAYAHSGRVEKAAEEAKEALEGDEGDELRKAEERAKATQPAPERVKR